MAPKKTNIKIKRSKINLYNKKKSKRRQAFTVIITVVVIVGLGVLGYGLGKPLLKYIQDRGNSSPSDSDTSALLSSIMNTVNSGSSGGEQTTASGGTSSETSAPEPVQKITDAVYYLPDNAAMTEASLSAALAEAKKSGCAVVAVTLKDTMGHMLYKTAIAEVKDTDTVTGTLTAAQIAQTISSEGFVPAARINTLMDQMGAVYTKGCYTFAPDQGGWRWNDDKDERGGKPWLSPFKTETISYIGNITSELSKAGYKHIICVNTRYPAFHSVDITTYLHHLPLTDSKKRIEALWNVVTSAKTSAENNGADIWLEMSAASIIAANRDCTDAELITDKEKLKGVKLVVNYDISNTSSGSTSTPSSTSVPSSTSTPSSTSASSSTSTPSTTSTPSSTSAPSTSVAASTSNVSVTTNAANTSGSTQSHYQKAADFISKAKTALGGAEFAVRLPNTLTGTALEEVKRAFTEADITVF